MIKSGRNVPTPEIPIPDFAVPYAAPIAVTFVEKRFVVYGELTADAIPAWDLQSADVPMIEAIQPKDLYCKTYKGEKWREFGSQLAFRHFEYLRDDEPSERSGKG
ncbi:hypothetical protein GB937_005660 [Aspergillus fischeri]|nr:hypothetical protein GB937_005660 [Aspergillus fischeri]